MSQIELRDISLTFSAPLTERANILSSINKQRMPEDLPRNGVFALDRINLTIPDGQIFVVVGPSGCGKSTLLRVISGLNSDYTGEVRYDGEKMDDIPPGDRFIGMVFQNYALYPHFKGEGNLSFFFKVHKIDDAETQERLRYTSELMGIGFNELLQRKPGTLSGGQKQRLAIARAIVRAPRLFLFDEPLSNLDAQLRTQTRVEIKRLLKRFGLTAIYVTHDQIEAIALADQIVVMRAGKIEQVGPYQTLVDQPVNMFVASFLGLSPMTLLPAGRVANGELLLDEWRIPLPERIRAVTRENQTLVLGLRPEAVSLPGADALPAGIQFKGEIETIQPDYSHRTQQLQLRSGRLNYPCLCPLDVALKAGDIISVQMDSERLYFFDQASGLAL